MTYRDLDPVVLFIATCFLSCVVFVVVVVVAVAGGGGGGGGAGVVVGGGRCGGLLYSLTLFSILTSYIHQTFLKKTGQSIVPSESQESTWMSRVVVKAAVVIASPNLYQPLRNQLPEVASHSWMACFLTISRNFFFSTKNIHITHNFNLQSVFPHHSLLVCIVGKSTWILRFGKSDLRFKKMTARCRGAFAPAATADDAHDSGAHSGLVEGDC